jgi:2-dehydro-3-deoxyphosphogluconate aldolase / (4S)-4-hydroxy-2-oxoglutarate aldolase
MGASRTDRSTASERGAIGAQAPRGLVAILRGRAPDRLERAARALGEAGVEFLEITMTVPQADRLIERLAGTLHPRVGAGTVMSAEQARRAIEAGASFVVSPACLPEVVEAATSQGIPSVLGGLTPTEVHRAWSYGAALVKVFPVERVGGPSYLRDLAGPLPDVRTMPSGGIQIDDLPAYRLPNVAAVGLGASLAPPDAIERGDLAELDRRARWARRTLVGGAGT